MPQAISPRYRELEERLGLKPAPEPLIEQALTHSSFVNETDGEAQSNERLEFLGDAVLGFAVANELYRRYPHAPEGDLTRMRAEIVRGSTLAVAAVRLGVGTFLRLGRGEEAAGGRERESNLAGAFEALIGAIYQAHGYRAARTASLRLLRPELETLRKQGAAIDAKSRLQHFVQSRWHQPPEYVTVEQEHAGSVRRFTVEVKAAGVPLGRGSGGSKRVAQQEAAARALVALAAQEQGGVRCT